MRLALMDLNMWDKLDFRISINYLDNEGGKGAVASEMSTLLHRSCKTVHQGGGVKKV